MVLIVRSDDPTLRLNIPIHQFGTRSSVPPRGPPWWLNNPYTTASCITFQPFDSVDCASVETGNKTAITIAMPIHRINMIVSSQFGRPKGRHYACVVDVVVVLAFRPACEGDQMRSGLRNAVLEEVPGGERSARANMRADTGGVTTSTSESPDRRASAGGLAALVIVAASADSVSQSYAGTDDNTDVVPAGATESAVP